MLICLFLIQLVITKTENQHILLLYQYEMEGISKRMLDDEESHVGSPGLRRQTNDGQECGAGT